MSDWICENCSSEIEDEEYDRTGTMSYCESCPELECGDPRGHEDGYCGCYEGDD